MRFSFGLIDVVVLRQACQLHPIYSSDVAAYRHTSKRAATRVLRRLCRARLLQKFGRIHDPYSFYYVPRGLLTYVLRFAQWLWQQLKQGLQSVEVDRPP